MPSLDRWTSRLASSLRLGHARAPGRPGPRPTEPLVLYQYEGCPMCRRVREAITDLALDVSIRPCPRGGTRFRPEGKARSPNHAFPFLVDPGRGEELAESADIVAYLYTHYGTPPYPRWMLGKRFLLTSQLVSMVRGPWLSSARPSREPPGEWVLHGAEADPDTLRVRQRLGLLEQPYLWKPGPLRLEDPQTSEALTDPESILAHLDARCAC